MTKLEDLRKRVGPKLKALRKANKKSQQYIADLLDVDQSAIHRMETGKQRLQLEQAGILAEHFGISVDWFLV